MTIAQRIDAALTRSATRYGKTYTLCSGSESVSFVAVCQFLGEADTSATNATFELWDFHLDDLAARTVGSFLTDHRDAVVRDADKPGFYFRPSGISPLVELTGHAGKLLKTRKFFEREGERER